MSSGSCSYRIVITGGGTGGHIYPALAVAESLSNDLDPKSILYIGASGHLEEKLAQEKGFAFFGLKVAGLPRQFSLKLLSWFGQFAMSCAVVWRLFKDCPPAGILGTGGYASAPVLMVASVLGIPFIIHEPDAHPGLVNRFFARKAKFISLGMAEAKQFLAFKQIPIEVNGNPVGQSFCHLPERQLAMQELGLEPSFETILITGGSQGAQALNKAVYQILPRLLAYYPQLQVLHQVGDKNWPDLEKEVDCQILQNPRYKPRKYFDDLASAYAVADFTICRAGAMTIAELFVTGTPAIFVPYPYAAQNHQVFNARYVQANGGARILEQRYLDGESLFQEISLLLTNKALLDEMRRHMLALAKPNAAENLAKQLKDLISKP